MSILRSARFEAQSIIKSQAIDQVELSEAGLGLQICNPAYINIVWGFEMTLGNKACSGNNVQKAVQVGRALAQDSRSIDHRANWKLNEYPISDESCAVQGPSFDMPHCKGLDDYAGGTC